MKRFWILSTIIVVVALIMVFTTASNENGASITRVLGMPVSCAADAEEPCWIALGGQGVLVLGGGIGIVEYGLAGVGLLFATGQIAAGSIVFGQLAFGGSFFAAQCGVGLTGVCQIGAGAYVASPKKKGGGSLGGDGRDFLRTMNAELEQLLRLI